MSAPFRTRDAVAWTGGELLQGDPERELVGVAIDSRSVAAGQLFVAIAGPRFDAHDFLAEVLAAGAAGLLVERGRALPASTASAIAVDDTTLALGALAAGHRAGHAGPVVAITGSNGKTTTKEMCAAALSVGAPCLRTEGNLNNQYGLPLTLLRRDASDRSVVVELGMNHRGEIAALSEIAKPTVGVITNIGSAHVEHLGSRDAIAQEKGDLVARLPADGVAVLNADDAYLGELEARTRARVVRFGLGTAAQVKAENVRALGVAGFVFELATPAGSRKVEVAGLGETTVTNALAAAAAALAAGASLDQVVEGLAAYQPPRGRLQAIALPDGGLLIDDSYNANPQSLEVALQTLMEKATGARTFAVLGDMGELGEISEECHRQAGRLAAELGVDRLYALGSQGEHVASGAAGAGMSAEQVVAMTDWEALAARIAKELRNGDRVLVKGSRAMKMERVVERLIAPTSGGVR